MRKITFLLSLFLLYIGNMSAEDLPFEPTTIENGAFVDAHWYRLKFKDKDEKVIVDILSDLSYNNSSSCGSNNDNSLYNGLFAFVRVSDENENDMEGKNGLGKYRIYSYYVGPEKGLCYEYTDVSSKFYLTWSENPTTFVLEKNTDTGCQFRILGTNSTYINNRDHRFGLWDKVDPTTGQIMPATNDGSTLILEEVTDMDAVKNAWIELVMTNFSLKSYANKVGGYTEAYANDLENKITPHVSNENNSLSPQNIRAGINDINSLYAKRSEELIMPKEGKYYRFISAYPEFESRNKTLAIINNGNGQDLAWGAAAESTDAIAYISQIWTLTPKENGSYYILQSQRDEYYPTPKSNTGNCNYTMSIDPVFTTLTIPDTPTKFHITPAGHEKPFHPKDHGDGEGTSGNIIAWHSGTDAATAWYIEEVEIKDVELAKMKLQAFCNDNMAGFPAKEDNATQVVWPADFEGFTSVDDPAELFTNAATLYGEGSDKSGIEAALGDIREYRTLVGRNGALASVTMTMQARYGTLILPSDVAVPESAEAYTCSNFVDGNILDLVKVEERTFSANKPYIVEYTGSDISFDHPVTYQLIGYDKQVEDDTVTEGLLTGTFERIEEAPEGSYVLQNNDGKLGFYKVYAGEQPRIGENRCYIDLSKVQTSGVQALFFGDSFGNTTDIETAIGGNAAEAAPVYDLSGRRVAQPDKGFYIVGSKKIFVK